ncbi:hypothetical protein GCM10011418_15790 [Sphingobacterium alkalisoli]|nr:hypothetical protein GCM10011418_15790 [Sphingobacterium alkalisoli]
MPVNLFTGQVQNDFSIYTFSEGDIHLPITLGYNYSGCRVSEHASSVGMGFSLGSGGLITRVVRGLPDEDTYGMLKAPARDADVSYDKNLANDVVEGFQDTEPDVFYFNFLGQAGEFYLTRDGNAVKAIPLVKSSLKIIPPEGDLSLGSTEFPRNWEWKIVDGEGNTYYFGQSSDAIEYTRFLFANPVSNHLHYASTFYLTKIVSQKGDQINLKYAKSGKISSFFESEVKYTNVMNGYPSPCSSLNSRNTNESVSEVSNLVSIEGLSGTIYFDVSLREDHPLVKKLDRIRVVNKSGELLRQCQFSYGYFSAQNNQKRLKLSSFTELDVIDGSNSKDHVFEYYENNLFPLSTSLAQDHWGYYNGNNTAGTLIPQINNCNDSTGVFYRLTGSNAEKFADRRSNENYGVTGMLKRIIYPTGGTTEFEYESHDYGLEDLCERIDMGEREFSSIGLGVSYTDPNIYNDIIKQTTFTLYHAQLVDVLLQAQVTNNHGPINMIQAYYEILDGTGNMLLREGFEDVYNDNYIRNIYLSPGVYTVRLIAEQPHYSLIYLDHFSMNSAITYILPASNPNAKVGGLRISKIKDFDGSANTNIRSFKYRLEEDTTKSSGFLHYYPIYASGTVTELCPTSNTSPIPPPANCARVSASSISPIGVVNGSHIGYSRVIEELQGGNGKIVYEYSLDRSIQDIRYASHTYYQKEKWKMGKLLKKAVFNGQGDTVLVVKNVYESGNHIVNDNYVVGTIVNKWYHALFINGTVGTIGCYPDKPEHKYHVNGYRISLQNDYRLKSESEWGYVKKADGSYELIKKISEFVYENPSVTSPTEIAKVNSNGVLTTRRFVYPYDMVQLNRDPNGIYAGMLSKNIVEPLIEQSNFVGNNQLVYRQRIAYNVFPGLMYLPEIVFLQKADGIEYEDIRFLKYSNRGKPLSVLNRAIFYTNYIWSYLGEYPVAEVRNVNYSTLESLLGGPGNISEFLTLTPNYGQIESFILPLRNNNRSMVRSFTYKPLVGMTSMTDPRGITQYYKYDGFQRLKDVLDFEDNVLKNYRYKYKP